MLTVAAPSSGTEAERAAHRLFTLWDSGIRVLGGVAAFRPYDDPTTKRRQSDVVLLVPDGVIVVRLVASQRQSGPIVAHPTGAWSIGGEVLRIIGGGSNPLPSLRDAQAAVTTTLRASGLEPGRVAMLVAVGSGEPVEPPDGQLGDGVIVCPMSEDGLAIGVRRAAAVTAAADVRQWTTADVKAALSSIGVTGRVPAVEELNSEGFMYSPYVLRRPDLVAAASAVAAAAASNTANRSALEAPTGPDSAPDDGPATKIAHSRAEDPEDAGLSGLFGVDARADAPPRSEMPPVALDPHPGDVDDVDGYDDASYAGVQYAEGRSAEGDSADQPYAAHADVARSDAARSYAEDGGTSPRRRRTGLRVVAVLLAVLLVGAAAYVGFSLAGPGGAGDGGNSQSTETTVSTAEPVTQQIGDHAYVPVGSRGGETCAGNADGEVAEYFATTDCAALARELYTTEIDGIPVIVAVARVTMPDEASAADFKGIVDSEGTGNVNDLLAAGETFPGGPTELVPEAYASTIQGAELTIIEAGWQDPANPGSLEALRELAREALALQRRA